MKPKYALFSFLFASFAIAAMERSFSDNYIGTFTPEEYEIYKTARSIAKTIIGLLQNLCDKKEIINQQEWLPDSTKLQTHDGLLIKSFFPHQGIVTPWGLWHYMQLEADISEKKIVEFNDELNKLFTTIVHKNDLYAPISQKDIQTATVFRLKFNYIPEKVAQAKWQAMTKKYEEIDFSPRSPRKRNDGLTKVTT